MLYQGTMCLYIGLSKGTPMPCAGHVVVVMHSQCQTGQLLPLKPCLSSACIIFPPVCLDCALGYISFKRLLVIPRPPTISTSTRLWFQDHCTVGAGSRTQQHLYGQWLLQGTCCLLKDNMDNLWQVLFVKERTVTVTSQGRTFDSSTLHFQPRNFCCLAFSQRDSSGLETGWG